MMKLSPFMKKAFIKNYNCYLFVPANLLYSSDQGIEITSIERIVKDVSFPVALCYFDKNIILFTEKDGSIRIIKRQASERAFKKV